MKRKAPKTPLSNVRPIGARALKSAIDTLRPHLAGAEVLELFAGQGRFGISCLDEGAAQITFVEKDAKTASELKTALAREAPRTRVLVDDVFNFVGRIETKFDIVFADPPFEMWEGNFAERLTEAAVRVLGPAGIFLVKHPKRVLPWPPNPTSEEGDLRRFPLQFWKTSPFGESSLLYLRHST